MAAPMNIAAPNSPGSLTAGVKSRENVASADTETTSSGVQPPRSNVHTAISTDPSPAAAPGTSTAWLVPSTPVVAARAVASADDLTGSKMRFTATI